jgi:N-acetylglucosaminyl-diphospho-decaprenol L-rhamnosyltransferase
VSSVTAVIVDYFSGEHLDACVSSLRAAGVEDIVVVDNSACGASHHIEGVTLVDPQFNLGYGRAVNRGVAASRERHPYLLITNPDVVVDATAVGEMLAVATQNTAALVGPQIRRPDGSIYPAWRIFPGPAISLGHALVGVLWKSNPWTRAYRSPGRSGRVDWVSGACFLVSRADFERVGGFDERYFMFAEDMDLCWRLARAGGRIDTAPRAGVMHVEGVSREHAVRPMISAHHRSAIRFAATTSRGWRRVTLPVAVAVLSLRWIIALARPQRSVRN